CAIPRCPKPTRSSRLFTSASDISFTSIITDYTSPKFSDTTIVTVLRYRFNASRNAYTPVLELSQDRTAFRVNIMKILVAYDGSKHAEAALDDLARAGLPASGEFLAVSVAEVWLPAPGEDEDPDAATNPYIERLVKERRARSQKVVEGAEHLAAGAAERLSNILPGWKAASRATYGSAAWALLDIAGEYDPDLIVVGSQGLSAVSQDLLGIVALQVAGAGKCLVLA